MHTRTRWLPLIALAISLLVGCASAPATSDATYRFPAQGQAATAWFGGDASQAIAPLGTQQASPEEMLVHAEALYWSGDVERAFMAYMELLGEHHAHPLSRFAAARLHDLHNDVNDYHDLIVVMLAALRYERVHPLTASYLSMIGQRVAWNVWKTSSKSTPFDADAQGLPLKWMTSPKLSPFRLGDFDQSFAPELESSLAAAYIAPVYASQDQVNRRKSKPYVASNINIAPDLPGSGIFYMETFATVSSTQDQVFWLYGNFASAARVWIDGQQVMERREDGYEASKRWRRIKLSPGTHRVLVKLAYQDSYRDWFDLNFLNPSATALDQSALTFSLTPPSDGAASGTIQLLSDQKLPSQLEPVLISADRLKGASDMELYLTALAAHYDRQADVFEPAYQELVKRQPNFAPIHGLKSAQVSTLWEVPAKLRDAQSLSALRRAHRIDPDNLHYLMSLGSKLQSRGKDREVEQMLQRARDLAIAQEDKKPRLRNYRPLNTWAQHLENQGWDEAAEQAWRTAVELAPSNCLAATKLQSHLHQRDLYLPPSKITPDFKDCPALEERWIQSRPEGFEQKLALAARDASRYPYQASAQVTYARALQNQGDTQAAFKVLEQAIELQPDSLVLYDELADLAFATQSAQAARQVIERASAEVGNTGWAVWRLATLDGDLPLVELLQDGPAVAMALSQRDPVSPPSSLSVESVEGEQAAASADPEAPATPAEEAAQHSGDEAFYAIDFAGKRYFENGSSVSITHTMVRVMTKNAIDRYAEVSVPGDARVLVARTIKQDGSTIVPQNTAGKETLSMPGLAQGDFVELAYIQYDAPERISRTQRDGTRFFFKMANISSLRSEYVVINPPADVLLRNGAPEPEYFDHQGMKAVRFLRTDSPRPRQEPYTVGSDEYLPWVQMYADGTTLSNFELGRRTWRDTLGDGLKLSDQARKQFMAWSNDALTRIDPKEQGARDKLVKDVYYQVHAFITSPSSSLSKDISHTVLTHEGNPLTLLYTFYKEMGFKAEIYLAKDRYANPQVHPLEELNEYSNPLLYIELPDSGEPIWLLTGGQDAMFGVMPDGHRGQPAICITCEAASEKIIPNDSPTARYDLRDMDIELTLARSGTASGTLTQVYDGPSAVYARSVLRQRTEETERAKFIEGLVTQHIPGSTIKSFEILGVESPDERITFKVDFERKQFASVDGKNLVFQATLFREPLASAYGTLSERHIDLMVGRARHFDDAIRIALPGGMTPTMRSKVGEWSLDSPFGQFRREVKLEGDTLMIEQKIDVPIQRVRASAYPEFQKWAIAVEQSSIVLMQLTP